MSMAALRLLANAIAVVALGYVGLCAWMYLKQRDFIYYPQFTRVAVQRKRISQLRRDGVTLRGWVVNPGQSRRRSLLRRQCRSGSKFDA